MPQHSHEIEIKLSVTDARSARTLLRKAGFRVSRPRVFEANTVFDTAELTLRKSGKLLRIRTAGKVATLTYKGRPVAGRHKSREELEVEISDAAKMSAIVDRLDFRAEFKSNLAIHGHAAGENDLFAGAAGCHACIGKEFLQTDQHAFGGGILQGALW